jgi:hypothetical protein
MGTPDKNEIEWEASPYEYSTFERKESKRRFSKRNLMICLLAILIIINLSLSVYLFYRVSDLTNELQNLDKRLPKIIPIWIEAEQKNFNVTVRQISSMRIVFVDVNTSAPSKGETVKILNFLDVKIHPLMDGVIEIMLLKEETSKNEVYFEFKNVGLLTPEKPLKLNLERNKELVLSPIITVRYFESYLPITCALKIGEWEIIITINFIK